MAKSATALYVPLSQTAIAAEGQDSLERHQMLAEIAREHHSTLLRLLTLRTGSREDAKEILQEAYSRLLSIRCPEKISRLPGYIYRIAINLLIDRSRRRGMDRRFRRDLLDHSGYVLSAETVAESRERLTIVARTLEELPERRLQAFLLHIYQGMTVAAVGKQMHISKRMAQKHLTRAFEQLHLSLKTAEGTSCCNVTAHRGCSQKAAPVSPSC